MAALVGYGIVAMAALGYGGPWLCRAVTIVYRFKVIGILVLEQHHITARICSWFCQLLMIIIGLRLSLLIRKV